VNRPPSVTAGNPAEKPYFAKSMDAAAPMIACLGHASRPGAIPVSASESVESLEPRLEPLRRDSAPAHRAGLEIVGFVFAGVTAVVIAIAVLVVHRHIDRRDTVGKGTHGASAVTRVPR